MLVGLSPGLENLSGMMEEFTKAKFGKTNQKEKVRNPGLSLGEMFWTNGDKYVG